MSAGPGSVRVFVADLDPGPERLGGFEALLSADEAARADRFRFARDRRRFVAARGILRTILGSCLGEPPEALSFRYSERGKPSVSGLFAASELSFNLAHSEDLGVVAIARGLELGVDLERVRPLADAAAIAERFFAPREAAALLALPEAERDRAFFACWTRKEAFIKATGEGLSRPLDAFEVAFRPGEPVRVTRVGDDPREAERWSLREFDPAPGFVGALAARGPIHELEVVTQTFDPAPAGEAPTSFGRAAFLEAR